MVFGSRLICPMFLRPNDVEVGLLPPHHAKSVGLDVIGLVSRDVERQGWFVRQDHL